MANRVVKFNIEVEYQDWWNDDTKEWMLPSWECVLGDIHSGFNLGDNALKITANDVVLCDSSKNLDVNFDVELLKLFRDLDTSDTDGATKLLEKLRKETIDSNTCYND